MPAFSKAPLEASVWYLVPFWVGVLNNITFDKIPISRLTASDLSKRSGAITALVIIVIVVFILALNQVRVMRKTGWLPHYLKWYIIGGLVLLVISQLPGLELRIHHYIISMALIPGTAFPTRVSAILQAFLLGMFLNGAAAFGFDSILQTAAEVVSKRFLKSPNWRLADFVQRGSLNKWVCKICSGTSDAEPMTVKTAQHHERYSEEHRLNVEERERQQWMLCEPDPAAWGEPQRGEFELTQEEVRMRESQTHVDLVRDMVPFWIRGIEAAERGEVLRLEEFLATLETSSWGKCGGDDGWGDGWKAVDERKKKDSRRRKRRQRQTSAHQFVEDIARQQAADEGRKQRMHRFFEVWPVTVPENSAADRAPDANTRKTRKNTCLVTTRTTSLLSVPHPSFALRFSDLAEIEAACAEPEEERAVRTIDWIGARINRRCAKWVEDMPKSNDKDSYTTPWWAELRRCIEGDHVPSRTEGWNHPVAHNRAAALFNAVKKQYGLHSYLLSLSLPTPPPPAVPVPPLIPRLPPHASQEQHKSPSSVPKTPPSSGLPVDLSGPTTIRLTEKDIQQTARFTREFLVMSLLPWMEKCVLDWNEAVCHPASFPLMRRPLTRGSSFHPLVVYRRACFLLPAAFLALHLHLRPLRTVCPPLHHLFLPSRPRMLLDKVALLFLSNDASQSLLQY
ncbi:hypothetical protein C0992_012066 [Termitomyces sp. T32_za158]|nr:hypothetical protein C0992_012066 [Termitomyces sp. T32_za158]